MRRFIAALILSGASLLAQINPQYQIKPVSADPSGACGSRYQFQYNYTDGLLFGCLSGTWTQIGGSSGAAAWGSITGTLSAQTDLQTALNSKVATSVTVAGHALSSNVTIACGDLTNAAASCSTDATNASNISSGILGASHLPNPTATTLGGIESFLATSHQWIREISTLGVPTASQPACGDLSDSKASCNTDTTNANNINSGTLPAAQLPNPSATTLGGIESLAAVTSKWINQISTAGVPSASQPAASDLSNGTTGSGAVVLAGAPTLTGNATFNTWTGSQPGAVAYYSAGSFTVANSSDFVLSFDTNAYNTGSVHSGTVNPTKFTVPTGQGGLYLLFALWQYNDANSMGQRNIQIFKNDDGTHSGSFQVTQNAVAGDSIVGSSVSAIYLATLAAGDVITFIVQQTSGGNITGFGGSNATTAGIQKLL